jgi:hypothetical protein
MAMLQAAKGAPDGPPGNDPAAGGTTQHRQISDVPDVIGGGVVDNSAMTIHQ